ncbi:hypothetical protein [Streptomyces sp. NPDC089919]|uniref:hypothetical protein n=1 Tax=Streptomyces sp. NPDC089919 TaxID=3155188 RepID=UPI00343BA8FE
MEKRDYQYKKRKKKSSSTGSDGSGSDSEHSSSEPKKPQERGHKRKVGLDFRTDSPPAKKTAAKGDVVAVKKAVKQGLDRDALAAFDAGRSTLGKNSPSLHQKAREWHCKIRQEVADTLTTEHQKQTFRVEVDEESHAFRRKGGTVLKDADLRVNQKVGISKVFTDTWEEALEARGTKIPDDPKWLAGHNIYTNVTLHGPKSFKGNRVIQALAQIAQVVLTQADAPGEDECQAARIGSHVYISANKAGTIAAYVGKYENLAAAALSDAYCVEPRIAQAVAKGLLFMRNDPDRIGRIGKDDPNVVQLAKDLAEVRKSPFSVITAEEAAVTMRSTGKSAIYFVRPRTSHAEQTLAMAYIMSGSRDVISIAGSKTPCTVCYYTLLYLVEECGLPIKMIEGVGAYWKSTTLGFNEVLAEVRYMLGDEYGRGDAVADWLRRQLANRDSSDVYTNVLPAGASVKMPLTKGEHGLTSTVKIPRDDLSLRARTDSDLEDTVIRQKFKGNFTVDIPKKMKTENPGMSHRFGSTAYRTEAEGELADMSVSELEKIARQGAQSNKGVKRPKSSSTKKRSTAAGNMSVEQVSDFLRLVSSDKKYADLLAKVKKAYLGMDKKNTWDLEWIKTLFKNGSPPNAMRDGVRAAVVSSLIASYPDGELPKGLQPFSSAFL